MLLNEKKVFFTFFNTQRIASGNDFSSSFSDQRRRKDHRNQSFAGNTTPLAFCNMLGVAVFFLLTMFNCFKPCVRARARPAVVGETDLAARLQMALKSL